MSLIAKNLSSIREVLAKTKSPLGEVTLLGVTKGQPIEKIREAVDLGVQHLGVNYAQDTERLMGEFGKKVRWHFIGHIQSRKAKLLTGYDCVESLERIEVAEVLSQKRHADGKTMDVLVEINIGGEGSKSGIAPNELKPFLLHLARLPGLRVRGLMCLPPPLYPVVDRKPFFNSVFELFKQHRDEFQMTTLSMGTSEDYPIAIECGANLIRLGTTLFGSRN